ISAMSPRSWRRKASRRLRANDPSRIPAAVCQHHRSAVGAACMRLECRGGRAMNAVLRILAWLLAIALVALPVVAVLNGWVGTERWPLAKLRVHGEFERVPAEDLQKALLPFARAGYFAVKLQDAQHAVEKLPWVESARVRKQWPDVLEVSIVEHKPFARWGKDRLLSEQGRLFAVPHGLENAPLPQLDGPDAKTAEVVELYNDFRALV